jgi:hypothetical protein
MNPHIALKQHQKDATWRVMSGGNTLLAHAVGAGKAQSTTSKLLTPTGWIYMGDVKVGDLVIAVDGTPTKVTGVFPQGEKSIYRLTFSDEASTEACGEHLWMTQNLRERALCCGARAKGHVTIKGQPKVRTTEELLATIDASHHIPIASPIQFQEQQLPLDPYTLGVLLGNACFVAYSVQMAIPDPEQLPLLTLPEGVIAKYVRVPLGKCPTVCFVAGHIKPNPLNNILRELGLWQHKSPSKFIPLNYLFSSVDTRLALLQGLMDTDGGMTGRAALFSSSSKQLAEQVRDLVRSLGGIASCYVRPPRGQPFQHGHLCARSLAVATCCPF